jgi:hypothetical protein
MVLLLSAVLLLVFLPVQQTATQVWGCCSACNTAAKHAVVQTLSLPAGHCLVLDGQDRPGLGRILTHLCDERLHADFNRDAGNCATAEGEEQDCRMQQHRTPPLGVVAREILCRIV